MSFKISSIMKSRLIKKTNLECQVCFRKLQWEDPDSANYVNIDHIIPRAMGGNNKIDNLSTLCKKCNSKKSSKLTSDRIKTISNIINNININDISKIGLYEHRNGVINIDDEILRIEEVKCLFNKRMDSLINSFKDKK